MMHMANDAVPMEIDLLNEQLCPVLPWPVEDCKTGVATWWPTIAMRVFDRAVAPYICGPDFIGSCSERPPPKYVCTCLIEVLWGQPIKLRNPRCCFYCFCPPRFSALYIRVHTYLIGIRAYLLVHLLISVT